MGEYEVGHFIPLFFIFFLVQLLMNRGNNSRRGRAPTLQNPAIRVALGSLKSSLHGHENKLRATNPPPVNQSPFNTIVVAEDIPGTGSFVDIDINDVCEKLRDQLFLNSSDNLRIKMLRMDVWCLSDETVLDGTANAVVNKNPSVTAAFYSTVQSIGGITNGAEKYPVLLKEIDDEGLAGQSAAVVSYSWPRAQADIPMKSAPADLTISEPRLIAQVRSPLLTTAKVRYHLNWNTVESTQSRASMTIHQAKQLRLTAPNFPTK